MRGEGRLERLLDGIEVSMHGTSSDKGGENPPRRKPKVSRVKFVFPGLAGP